MENFQLKPEQKIHFTFKVCHSYLKDMYLLKKNIGLEN